MRTIMKSAMIFDALVSAGIPEIKGVYAPECGGGRMLVIRRGPDSMLPGYWSPPSGRIEPGESQHEAVIRESARQHMEHIATGGDPFGVPHSV